MPRTSSLVLTLAYGLCFLCLLPASVILIPGSAVGRLWPSGIIYYTIDPAVPNPQRVVDAIQIWNGNTPLQILPRTTQTDYVQFVRTSGPGAVCESGLGMLGGAQSIEILDGCTAGMIAHEIGHAFGLQHEQVRNDRNDFVTVRYENVDKRRYLNFEQAPFLNRAIGYYDYDSIMHYGPKVFGVDDSDTIETVPVGIPIGQRATLSAGDIDGISRAYGFTPSTTTITTIPAGLSVLVDGAATQTPHSYSWASGSMHTVSVATAQGTTPRYAFVRWSDGGNASHTVAASSGTTVFCAEFQEQHQLTLGIASGDGTVTATPASPDGYYPQRQPVIVDANPSGGSRFVAWMPTTDLAANGESISKPHAVSEVLNPDTQFSAIFSTGPLTTIDSTPSGRRITVDGVSYTTPINFAWQAGSTHTLAAPATQTSTTGSAEYLFTGWQDGNTSGTRTATASDSDATFTAAYSTEYLLTTDTVGAGTVTASPTSVDGYYPAGTVVQLTAAPSAGSFLRYWLGDPSGGNPTVSVTMDRQRLATAFFNTINGVLVTSAVSYIANPLFNVTGAAVAPDELISVFGSNIGPASNTPGVVDSSGKVTTSLAGAQVTFDGVPAPITFASANQINAVVPAGVTPGVNTTVRVLKNGSQIGLVGVGVDSTAPALAISDSSGRGQAAALNQDQSVNSPTNPAPHGSVITLYATGGGLSSVPIADGQVNGATLTAPAAAVQVRIDKLPTKILYAGTAPGLINGVLQVNFKLPVELLGGPAVSVQLIVGELASPPGITLAVQ